MKSRAFSEKREANPFLLISGIPLVSIVPYTSKLTYLAIFEFLALTGHVRWHGKAPALTIHTLAFGQYSHVETVTSPWLSRSKSAER